MSWLSRFVSTVYDAIVEEEHPSSSSLDPASSPASSVDLLQQVREYSAGSEKPVQPLASHSDESHSVAARAKAGKAETDGACAAGVADVGEQGADLDDNDDASYEDEDDYGEDGSSSILYMSSQVSPSRMDFPFSTDEEVDFFLRRLSPNRLLSRVPARRKARMDYSTDEEDSITVILSKHPSCLYWHHRFCGEEDHVLDNSLFWTRLLELFWASRNLNRRRMVDEANQNLEQHRPHPEYLYLPPGIDDVGISS
eukprot:ANDGO_04127.mRNA.1 hypothetical protein